MSKFFADFDASLAIEAENEDEARTKFWEIIDLFRTVHEIECIGLDGIEKEEK